MEMKNSHKILCFGFKSLGINTITPENIYSLHLISPSLLLFIVFGGLVFYFNSIGGYKPINLVEEKKAAKT